MYRFANILTFLLEMVLSAEKDTQCVILKYFKLQYHTCVSPDATFVLQR